MLDEMKESAKKEQLKRLIAMLNERLLHEGDDEEKDEGRDLEKVVREDMDGKRDEIREEMVDKDPEEDMEEDEDRHRDSYEEDKDDLEEDLDDDDTEGEIGKEDNMLREDMQRFLGGDYMMPDELMNKKSKRLMMGNKPNVKIDAMVARMEAKPRKRGRKKKA